MGLRENSTNSQVDGSSEYSRPVNQLSLTAPFGAVVLLHVVGCLFPGSATWGFSCWGVTEPLVTLSVFALSTALLWPRITTAIAAFVEPAGARLSQSKPLIRTGALVLGLLAAGVLMYLCRCRALFYGDGYTVLSDASGSDKLTFQLQSYFQVLSIYFYHYVLRLADYLTAIPAEKVYAMVNVAGGMAGLWALFRLSGQITTVLSSRVFVLVGSLSSASILLFFGYVENYTWSLALGLWTLSFAIRFTKKGRGAFGLVALAVPAVLFHAAALPFAVVALLALFMRSTPGGNMVMGIRLRTVNVCAAVAALILAAGSQLARIHILVPLFPVDGNMYAALSTRHIVDVFNQAVLVGGLGLALATVSLIHQRKRVFAIGPEDGILGTTAFLTFLAAFWINPDIGAPRDWDLLAFFGLPVTLWGLFRFTKLFPGRAVASKWSVAAAVVVVIHLGANLYEKNHPDLALSRLDALLYADPHYQIEYKSADRCLAWAAILQQAIDRPDLAVKYLKRRVEAVAEEHQACFNIGDIYFRQGNYDSAAKYMSMGLRSRPDDIRFLLNLCLVEQHRGNYENAVQLASLALEIEPDNIDALTHKGVSLSYVNKPKQALACFGQAYRLSPAGYDQIVNLGVTYALARMPDSAYHYICLALPLAPDQKKPDLCCCAISAALELGRLEEAAYHLEKLKEIAPRSPDIPVFEASLAELAGR